MLRFAQPWGQATREHIAQHYLSLLRDCGFATGSAQKTLRRPFVSPDVVLFAVQLILGGGQTPAQVPTDPLFTALGLDLQDVLNALTELHAQGKLRFATQGGVVYIELPPEEETP
jgi:hypothetical protein